MKSTCYLRSKRPQKKEERQGKDVLSGGKAAGPKSRQGTGLMPNEKKGALITPCLFKRKGTAKGEGYTKEPTPSDQT